MPGKVTHCGLVLLLLSGMTGCQWNRAKSPPPPLTALPVDSAPQIKLRRESKPAISTVSHRLEPKVQIQDMRPEVERQYYPGETDPHRWPDAVTILPMESFLPQLETAIRDEVASSAGDLLKYRRIRVEIRSFHVALDERERGENQLLKDFRKWDDERELKEAEEEAKRRQENEDRETSEVIADAVFRALVIAPVKESRKRREKHEQTKVLPQTLPEVLTRDKQSGWNCRFTADVILVDEEGSETIPISVAALVAKDDSMSVEDQIERTVASALEEFGRQLQMKIAETRRN